MNFKFVQPNPNVVTVVDRIKDVPYPEYCPHGKTRCMRCDEWCWLGDQSLEIVSSGKATPVCSSCAVQLVPPNSMPLGTLQNTSRKDDH